jgi:hypothetical protein
MNKPLVSIAAVLGVVFLVLACIYWFVPAGSLPAFMPGFVEGSTHVHVKYGLVALVLLTITKRISFPSPARTSQGQKSQVASCALAPRARYGRKSTGRRAATAQRIGFS